MSWLELTLQIVVAIFVLFIFIIVIVMGLITKPYNDNEPPL